MLRTIQVICFPFCFSFIFDMIINGWHIVTPKNIISVCSVDWQEWTEKKIARNFDWHLDSYYNINSFFFVCFFHRQKKPTTTTVHNSTSSLSSQRSAPKSNNSHYDNNIAYSTNTGLTTTTTAGAGPATASPPSSYENGSGVPMRKSPEGKDNDSFRLEDNKSSAKDSHAKYHDPNNKLIDQHQRIGNDISTEIFSASNDNGKINVQVTVLVGEFSLSYHFSFVSFRFCCFSLFARASSSRLSWHMCVCVGVLHIYFSVSVVLLLALLFSFLHFSAFNHYEFTTFLVLLSFISVISLFGLLLIALTAHKIPPMGYTERNRTFDTHFHFAFFPRRGKNICI